MTDKRSVSADLARGCNRAGPRFRLLHAGASLAEFRTPDGRAWRLDLLEIGAGGVLLGLEGGRPQLPVGTTVDGVTLQVEGTTLAGSLTVAHVTDEFAAGTVCGAAFLPASDEDARKLAEVLTTLAR